MFKTLMGIYPDTGHYNIIMVVAIKQIPSHFNVIEFYHLDLDVTLLHLCVSYFVENMCPDLESLENGVIRITEVGFEAGLLATYECNEGYTISSAVDATRICQLSGEWTGTAPTCTSTYSCAYVMVEY